MAGLLYLRKNSSVHIKRNVSSLYYIELFFFLFDDVTELHNILKKKETEIPNDTRNNELCQEHSSLYENRK